jgi:hypothetical protein
LRAGARHRQVRELNDNVNYCEHWHYYAGVPYSLRHACARVSRSRWLADSRNSRFLCLLTELGIATITYTHVLGNSKVGEGHCFRGALLIEHLSTVPTVVLAIGEGEGRSTAETHIRVDPLWCCLCVHHGRVSQHKVLWRKFVSYGDVNKCQVVNRLSVLTFIL